MRPLAVAAIGASAAIPPRRELDLAPLALLPVVTEGHPPLIKLLLGQAAAVVVDDEVFTELRRNRQFNPSGAGIPRVGDEFAESHFGPPRGPPRFGGGSLPHSAR